MERSITGESFEVFRRFARALLLESQPANMTYMRVQIDRFEDNGWAVLLLYPDGKRSFDIPREMLPEEVREGDVFEVRFEPVPEESERLAEENRSLLDELLKRNER